MTVNNGIDPSEVAWAELLGESFELPARHLVGRHIQEGDGYSAGIAHPYFAAFKMSSKALIP
eukprot:3131092-Rhodomonas_salina.1